MTTLVPQLTKLSHKAFRALLKKFKRKNRRQQLALARERQELLEQKRREASPNYKEREEERLRHAQLWDQFQEKESIRKHKEWLQREIEAQAEFVRKKCLTEEEKSRKDEERKKMLAELEEKNLLDTITADQSRKAKEKKEEALQEALSGLPTGNEPWHNPMAPENYNVASEMEQCSFFAKTGCCRFGDRCSRGHLYPEVSPTLLIRGMYFHISIEQGSRDDYDTDMALEFEDLETYKDFQSFYNDALPEFKKCGRVVQFKVCCNHEPHLRGNVYIQYSREEYAVEAYKKFNGRFYAGKQITCEFTNITNWKSAVCGLFLSKRCPKGNQCNFLHVFRNPDNEFWAADRNLPDYMHVRYQRPDPANGVRGFLTRRSRTRHSDDKRPRSSDRSSTSRSTSKSLWQESRTDWSDDEPSSRGSTRRRHDRSSSSHRERGERSSSGSPERERKRKKKHKKYKKRKKKRTSSPA